MKNAFIGLAAITLVLITVIWIGAQHSKESPEASEFLTETIDSTPSSVTPAQPEVDLSFLPDVDPNESASEIAKAYWEARGLIIQGDWDRAKITLEEALVQFPESRHLHKQLAELLWAFYTDKTKDRATLDRAIEEAVHAAEIGFSFDKVDYHLTGLLTQALGKTGDVETLNGIFTKALALDPSSTVYLDYARGLSLMGSPQADSVFRSAVRLEPENTVSALTEYSEWLLEHGRENEVVQWPTKDNPYLHFLHGVALERLNRLDEARAEYTQFNAAHPVPERFKIPDSKIQAESEIRFKDKEERIVPNKQSSNATAVSAAVSSNQTIKGLSYLIGSSPK